VNSILSASSPKCSIHSNMSSPTSISTPKQSRHGYISSKDTISSTTVHTRPLIHMPMPMPSIRLRLLLQLNSSIITGLRSITILMVDTESTLSKISAILLMEIAAKRIDGFWVG